MWLDGQAYSTKYEYRQDGQNADKHTVIQLSLAYRLGERFRPVIEDTQKNGQEVVLSVISQP